MKTQKLPFWKRQLPNMITWLRILAIIPVVILLRTDNPDSGFWAMILFIAASLSDYLDGYLARIYHVESLTGKFLDPVADKLLVTAALIMLIPLGRISAVVVILLLCREFLINGLRTVAMSENLVISPTWTAKYKTGAQMAGIPMLIYKEPLLGIPVYNVGVVLIWVAIVLGYLSAWDYLKLFYSKTGPFK